MARCTNLCMTVPCVFCSMINYSRVDYLCVENQSWLFITERCITIGRIGAIDTSNSSIVLISKQWEIFKIFWEISENWVNLINMVFKGFAIRKSFYFCWVQRDCDSFFDIWIFWKTFGKNGKNSQKIEENGKEMLKRWKNGRSMPIVTKTRESLRLSGMSYRPSFLSKQNRSVHMCSL